MGTRLSHCSRCGQEVKQVSLGITDNVMEVEPRFCRICGNALFVEGVDDHAPWDEFEDDEEFSLYNFDDLEEIVKGIVPENYKDLTPDQLERHAVQAIWKRVRGIDPYPNIDTTEMDAEHERQMQIALERGIPPGFIMQSPRSTMDKSLGHLVRQYHLVWVNGLIGRWHLSATPSEAKELRTMLASSYYLVLPCDCDKVTYIPDEANPNSMHKA
jgi:hypothetical protein